MSSLGRLFEETFEDLLVVGRSLADAVLLAAAALFQAE